MAERPPILCVDDEPHVLEGLKDMLRRHFDVTSEKLLLEQTLRGAVEALTEVLGLADPEAFGRAGRVTAYAAELAGMAGLPAWKLELAAMLLHVGYVALPPSVTAALATGAVMTEADQEALDRIPVIAEQ